jgi:hypothetical protein
VNVGDALELRAGGRGEALALSAVGVLILKLLHHRCEVGVRGWIKI